MSKKTGYFRAWVRAADGDAFPLCGNRHRSVLRSLKRHGRLIIEEIQDKAEDLALFPEKKGKPFVKTLAGLWSRRACHQRYRIIYRINEEDLTVEVIYAGIRKAGSREDVYETTKKLTNLRRRNT